MKANPRTVLVLQTGNPLVLTPRARSARAILQAWYAGQDTGTVIAEVLFGDTNPSGKLPITFYASLADLPPMDDYDVRKGRTYMYLAKEPAFPFGHGLSYTSFRYESVVLAPSSVRQDGTLRIELDITNVGARPGVGSPRSTCDRPVVRRKSFAPSAASHSGPAKNARLARARHWRSFALRRKSSATSWIRAATSSCSARRPPISAKDPFDVVLP